jgi:hypothetical protein
MLISVQKDMNRPPSAPEIREIEDPDPPKNRLATRRHTGDYA